MIGRFRARMVWVVKHIAPEPDPTVRPLPGRRMLHRHGCSVRDLLCRLAMVVLGTERGRGFRGGKGFLFSVACI